MKGYDPNFLPGHEVPLPVLGKTALEAAFNGGQVIDHTRYSLVFNKDRGLAMYTAHNIDGESLFPHGTIPRKDRFRPDPEIEHALQIDNDRGYRNNPWDRGHLVRRASLHWGKMDDARQADSESFFWTNIAPQHKHLHHGAWGDIERWMVDFADSNRQRACVFTGPVFTPDDPVHGNQPDTLPVLIPAAFWKVLALLHDNTFKAAGFLVWQRDYDSDSPVLFDPHLEQIRITTLEHVTGLSFGQLRFADPLRFEAPAPGTSRSGAPAGQAPAPPRAGVILDRRDIVI